VEQENTEHANSMLKLLFHICATFNLENSVAQIHVEVEMDSSGVTFVKNVNPHTHHLLQEKSIVFGGHSMQNMEARRRTGDVPEFIHQMQHRDVTLKDKAGRPFDIQSVLDSHNATGLLPGTVFLPLGPDGRELYIQHPIRREMIRKGEYLFFNCLTTHGGITFGRPEGQESTRWYPALHLHLDSKYIQRTASSLNYDTKEAEEGIDYLPPEHHRSADFHHIVQHAKKASSELKHLMESLKEEASNCGHLKKSVASSPKTKDWEECIEAIMKDLVAISGSVKTIAKDKLSHVGKRKTRSTVPEPKQQFIERMVTICEQMGEVTICAQLGEEGSHK
jgi:hypothetical protein